MRHARPTLARAGVTLIELLVVMLIIAILASLILSAVFTVRESQMKSFTETLVNKLASALDGQWKAAVDQIREESVPAWATTMAGGDPRRARVLYTKARLKQEFPVTFYEAVHPYANYDFGPPNQTGRDQINLATGANGAAVLPSKPAYAKALTPLVPSVVPLINQTIPTPNDYEASALLYLTLTQGRRGQVGFNPDEHIEPTAIQTRTIAGVQFKIFVDSWGNPLRLWTFPYANDELNDPNNRYRNAFVQNQQSPDPQDPEQTLLQFLSPGNARFTAMIHPLAVDPAQNPQKNYIRLLIPVIGSAGRDGAWGTDNFNMSTANLADTSDNIYSYRLRRSGARGD
jgi:prepilin-type N-terminal cleavage/methylation domain-containing protein